MKNKVVGFKKKHPFLSVLIIAIILRLIAAVFAKGYGFNSEHFSYVETPNAWIDNIEYQYINLNNPSYDQPQGTSLFYVSINYLWFGFLKLFGMRNPQWLMFFSRLLHAFISLFVISFSYRIAELISDKKTAWRTALLLSVLWFMPYISVHNIAAFVCVPFLMYGTLIILKQDIFQKTQHNSNLHRSSFIIAGFFLGLGFSIWYRSILYILGIVLALMIMKNWKNLLMTLIGLVISIGIVQTIPDLIVWGRPFAELQAFLQNSNNYIFSGTPHSPWIYYSFLMLLLGLIPPFSIMIMWGYFRYWKKYLLLFLPTFLFLLYYTIFPNSNGIYILPIIPLFIVLGVVGWREFKTHSKFWQKRPYLYRYLMSITAFINLAILAVTTTMYFNKAEVKAMSLLSKDKHVDCFVIEDVFSNDMKKPPVFYAKYWPQYVIVNQDNSLDTSLIDKSNKDVDYVLFRESKDIDKRVTKMKRYYPDLQYEVTYKPHFMDIFYKWLNKSDKDGNVRVYKVGKQK